MKDFLTSDMPEFKLSDVIQALQNESPEQARLQYVKKSFYHPDGLAIYLVARLTFCLCDWLSFNLSRHHESHSEISLTFWNAYWLVGKTAWLQAVCYDFHLSFMLTFLLTGTAPT